MVNSEGNKVRERRALDSLGGKHSVEIALVTKIYRGASRFYFEIAENRREKLEAKSKGSNVQFQSRHRGNYASRPLRN